MKWEMKVDNTIRLDSDIDNMILIHDNARTLKVLEASSEYSFSCAVIRERERSAFLSIILRKKII